MNEDAVANAAVLAAVIATFIGAAAFIGFMILAMLALNRRVKGIRDLLRSLAASADWTNLRNVFFAAAGVKGRWGSFPASLSYHSPHKGSPRRMILAVAAWSDTTLIVKRKLAIRFWNKPIMWFGPPIIEVHQPWAEEFWIRGDAMLADRLFGDASLASQISRNLVVRFDEIRIDRNGLRIKRAVDDPLVRAKYGLPMYSLGFNAEDYEPFARQELALAEALVDKLTMR